MSCPTFWKHGALSHIMIRAHQELHTGITLKHINHKHTICKNNDSFVDNDDAEAVEPGTKTHNTLQHLQRGAQYWDELIEASGGSIAFHKGHIQILS